MNGAIVEGSDRKVRLVAPYTNIDKRAIGLRGRDLGVDYANTWSCYKGLDIHCGKCGTCVERKEALEGFDPTTYQD
jgi:7-cyano-7-deazaguanine synthase